MISRHQASCPCENTSPSLSDALAEGLLVDGIDVAAIIDQPVARLADLICVPLAADESVRFQDEPSGVIRAAALLRYRRSSVILIVRERG